MDMMMTRSVYCNGTDRDSRHVESIQDNRVRSQLMLLMTLGLCRLQSLPRATRSFKSRNSRFFNWVDLTPFVVHSSPLRIFILCPRNPSQIIAGVKFKAMLAILIDSLNCSVPRNRSAKSTAVGMSLFQTSLDPIFEHAQLPNTNASNRSEAAPSSSGRHWSRAY